MKFRPLAPIAAILLCSAAFAQTPDPKYLPKKDKDPIYNSENQKAAEEAKRRKASAEASKDAPLLKKDINSTTSISSGSPEGGVGAKIEKKTK